MADGKRGDYEISPSQSPQRGEVRLDRFDEGGEISFKIKDYTGIIISEVTLEFIFNLFPCSVLCKICR